jgi:hypothetical protein
MKRVTTLTDLFLLVTVFAITFAKVRWTVQGLDFNVSDVTAGLFVVAFVGRRVWVRDWSAPRTVGILTLFFAAFALVYSVGYFNLETTADRAQFLKGLAKFALHFALVLAAVAHLARRGEAFYWRVLAWFAAGFVANALYGLAQLAAIQVLGVNLDQTVLSPIGAYRKGGISFFGEAAGIDLYQPNALTLDPNHLAIMLVVPLLVLLPIIISLERGHRLRAPLAVLFGLLLLVEATTLSRSGALGFLVGLAVLLPAYRRVFLTRRVLVPVGALAALAGVLVLTVDFFAAVFRSRTNLSGGSVQIHLDFYELLPPALVEHPLFGRGLNTFSTYFEFLTGRTNWGPHSYYVAVLIETGVVGALLFLAFLAYLLARLGALHEVGRRLAVAGDGAAATVQPLAWGFTAALAGTLAANAFYLTMQMYYFFLFILVAVAAPVVLARERALPRPSPRLGRLRSADAREGALLG